MDEIFNDDDMIDGELSIANEGHIIDSIISITETYLLPTLNRLYTDDKARKAFLAVYFMCNGSTSLINKCLEMVMWSLLSSQ